VALAGEGDRTIAELASEFGVHPNQNLQLEEAAAGRRGRASLRAAAWPRGRPARRRSIFCRQIGQLKVENDFWHESSADEPSATPRADRARGTGAAGIAANAGCWRVSRASIYRQRPRSGEEERTIMALIDRQYLARPYYGFAPDAPPAVVPARLNRLIAGGRLPAEPSTERMAAAGRHPARTVIGRARYCDRSAP